MRLSKMHIKTLREVPNEAEIASHILLLRTGMIRKLVSGVYGFMPLGWRSIRKIEEIIRADVDKINETVPSYKQIYRLIITDEPMVKTTTGKVKRFEEVKKM